MEDRRWYAVFTLAQHERSVLKRLANKDIEAFLPIYETTRVWKNRQKVTMVLPLFPTYVFVNIHRAERIHVLQTTGVLQILGNSSGPLAISEAEILFLREGFQSKQVEPYPDLVVGERVRIRTGAMAGVEGTLVRRQNSLRFVLRIALINQHAAVEIEASNLEAVRDAMALHA